MLITMIMNLITVLVYSILSLALGEYEAGAPVSKRALAAATHAIQPLDCTGKFPDLEASPSLLGGQRAFILHQALCRVQEAFGAISQAKKKSDFQSASSADPWIAQAAKNLGDHHVVFSPGFKEQWDDDDEMMPVEADPSKAALAIRFLPGRAQ
ncbi:hypothetical protein AK812_SmicGene32787 [Symbiodinium microadriaticum]|uniref:Uncharacterized protein n=1 Tax=Symbiodinium microadriaticum TaxID=2951 RepID=A0A1Q9CT99_SYMMI|nr:hypothetical protein AK812_SmicGene32787 [Symbiodinium microadriaticum]